MKTGAQLYSVRTDLEQDFFGTLKRVKEMGYDGVEFAGLYGKDSAEINRYCNELGLEPISAHVPFVEMLNNLEKVMSDYEAIGCKYIAIPYLNPEHRPGQPGFNVVLENAEKIGRCAKQHGMQLLYHNHNFEFEKINGEYALDILYQSVPAEFLQTEIDTCWVNVAEEDPAAYVRKYTGRSPVVHLKDFYKKGHVTGNVFKLIGSDEEEQCTKDFEFRPLGCGMQDVQGLLDASKGAGAEWVIVEQDENTMGLSRMESIQKSIDYLKTLKY